MTLLLFSFFVGYGLILSLIKRLFFRALFFGQRIGVIGDNAGGHGYVEVAAKKNLLALQVNVDNGFLVVIQYVFSPYFVCSRPL